MAPDYSSNDHKTLQHFGKGLNLKIFQKIPVHRNYSFRTSETTLKKL